MTMKKNICVWKGQCEGDDDIRQPKKKKKGKKHFRGVSSCAMTMSVLKIMIKVPVVLGKI
jgi:hypothetical protein